VDSLSSETLRIQIYMALKNLTQVVPDQSWVLGYVTSGRPFQLKLLHDSYVGFLMNLCFFCVMKLFIFLNLCKLYMHLYTLSMRNYFTIYLICLILLLNSAAAR